MLLIDSGWSFQYHYKETLCYPKSFLYNPISHIFGQFSLIKLLGMTIFNSVKPIEDHSSFFEENPNFENKYHILSILYCTDMIFQSIFTTLFYTINIGIAYDLVMTIRDPFSKTKMRKRNLIVALFLFPILMLLGILGYFNGYYFKNQMSDEHSFCGDERIFIQMQPFYGFMLLTLVLSFIFSIIYVFQGLKRKGLNKEVR